MWGVPVTITIRARTCGTVALVLAIMGLSLVIAAPPASAASSFTWSGKGDHQSWGDAQNWSPPDVPVDGDSVSIAQTPGGPANVTVPSSISLSGLTLGTGGRLFGGTMSVTDTFDWTGGDINIPFTLESGSTGVVSGLAIKSLLGPSGRIDNAGDLTVDGSGAGPVFMNFGPVQLHNT